MRRPVKYNANQLRKNKIILIVVSVVLALGIIGGATAAVMYFRDEEGPVISVNGTGSDQVSDSDTVGTDDTAGTDTETVGTDTETAEGTEPTDTDPATVDTDTQTETDITSAVSDTTSSDVGSGSGVESTSGQGGSTAAPVDVSSTKNYKGGYLSLADYPTKSALSDAAMALAKSGCTAVMIDLKYDNGKLSYESTVEQATTYGANPTVAAQSLPVIVETLHEAGLYVTGRVCAFRDDIAAKSDADAALMNASGFRYSDGTSRWLSVYSDAGQDYILALLTEMEAAGVDEVMLRDYGLPEDSGTTAPAYSTEISKTDAVTAFVKRIVDEVPALTLSLEMDAMTILDGENAVQGINTAKLSTLCDSITADITLSSLSDGMTVGGVTIADVSADPEKTVNTVLTALENTNLTIRPLLEETGNAASDAAQIAAVTAKGYDAYQMTEKVVKMTEK